jgi:hypothetical protein
MTLVKLLLTWMPWRTFLLRLDDDADSDEGTIVVIGRTHFFSGEMRCYDG